MTEHSFKTRYNNHKLSFKHRKHSHNTVLSKYIWDLKDNTVFSIKWSIVTRASSYRGNPSRCNLCLTEKLCILSRLGIQSSKKTLWKSWQRCKVETCSLPCWHGHSPKITSLIWQIFPFTSPLGGSAFPCAAIERRGTFSCEFWSKTLNPSFKMLSR